MTAISLRNAFKTSSFFGSGQRQQGEVYQETEPMSQFKEVVVVSKMPTITSKRA